MNDGDRVRIKDGVQHRFSGMVGEVKHVISEAKVLVRFVGADGVPRPNAIVRVEHLELAD